jgi:APA family basic amino acid/polyamine antiporter
VTELRRELRFWDAAALVTGTMIGSGIFLVPNLVTGQIASPVWILAVWAFSGVLTLAGGLAFAELGAMFPATGGQYVYLREAYGPGAAFLCGWSSLLVIYAGAVAWMAMSFALYLGHFVPLSAAGHRAVAIALIAGLTAVNYRGLTPGRRTQNALTFFKLGGLATVIVVPWLAPAVTQVPAPPPSVPAFGIAMVACLLTYDGWVALGYVAGEVERPQHTIPRALGAGIGFVMLAYLAANVSYLRVMTVGEIAASPRVAADALARVTGTAGGGLVALAVCLSVAGAVNGFVLAPPRQYFAMARDGLFFARFGEPHQRFGTPHRAILLQGAGAVATLLTGTYETLGSFAMLAAWLFYGLAVGALVVLRRTRPDQPRPYRMPGYPWSAALFLLGAAGFIGNTVRETPRPALACLALMAAGLPAYAYWKHQAHGQPRRRAGG